jgi:pre-mRNA-splicing factor 18
MDALKAEIAFKRKTAEADLSSRPTKYMRRGDIERMKQEEEEQRAKGEKERIVQEEVRKKVEAAEVSTHPPSCCTQHPLSQNGE